MHVVIYLIFTQLDNGDSVPILNGLTAPIIGIIVILRFPKFVIVHSNFRESSSSVLYSLNMAIFSLMLAHITKLLRVSFKCFLSILALSVKS